MQRFVCSLLPGPGEGEVEVAALSASPRLRNSFGCPCRVRPLPQDQGEVVWLVAVPAGPSRAGETWPVGAWGPLSDVGKLRQGASVLGTLCVEPGGGQAAPSGCFGFPPGPGGAGVLPWCSASLRVPPGRWGERGRVNSQLSLPRFSADGQGRPGRAPPRLGRVLRGCGSLAGGGGTDVLRRGQRPGGHPSPAAWRRHLPPLSPTSRLCPGVGISRFAGSGLPRGIDRCRAPPPQTLQQQRSGGVRGGWGWPGAGALVGCAGVTPQFPPLGARGGCWRLYPATQLWS